MRRLFVGAITNNVYGQFASSTPTLKGGTARGRTSKLTSDTRNHEGERGNALRRLDVPHRLFDPCGAARTSARGTRVRVDVGAGTFTHSVLPSGSGRAARQTPRHLAIYRSCWPPVIQIWTDRDIAEEGAPAILNLATSPAIEGQTGLYLNGRTVAHWISASFASNGGFDGKDSAERRRIHPVRTARYSRRTISKSSSAEVAAAWLSKVISPCCISTTRSQISNVCA
jgi:hypothetical protein